MLADATLIGALTGLGYGAACAAAASTGAGFPPDAWYQRLSKPPWTPPNWLFPLAWTILYIVIAWCAWRVSLSGSPEARAGLALWAAQIAFNAIWTPVFFGLRQPGAALAVMAALWLSALGAFALFLAADLLAGLAFGLYMIWLSYAGALNLSVWRRNPAAARI